jgi:UDP:flavonoid glycosyltransferase YjiC (YdhE family)
LQDAGAGLYCDSARLTPELLRDMIVRVLGDRSFATAAARIRRELLGTPAPREIVPVLERLTAAYRSG